MRPAARPRRDGTYRDRMLLRAMRRPGGGRSSTVARAVALLLVLGLVATVSPWLVRATYWVLSGFVGAVL